MAREMDSPFSYQNFYYPNIIQRLPGGHAEQKKRQQETPVSGCWQFITVWWGQGRQPLHTGIARQDRAVQFFWLVSWGKMDKTIR